MAAGGRIEFLSPEGLRVDGRRPNELRSYRAQLAVIPQADGSALFSLGNTTVIATVYGPRDNNNHNSSNTECSINTKIHAAAFSSTTGDRRKAGSSNTDRRLQDWSETVSHTISGVLLHDLFPRTSLDIFVEVLSADGAVLAASINAVSLALVDAGVPMRDPVVALQGVIIREHLLLDGNRLEERAGAPTTLAFTPRNGKIVGVMVDPKYPQHRFQDVCTMLQPHSESVFAHLDSEVIRPRLKHLYSMLKQPTIKSHQ